MKDTYMDFSACIGAVDMQITAVKQRLESVFSRSRHQIIVQAVNLLSEVPDMWLRAAFVMLSANAADLSTDSDDQLCTDVATSVELLHVADLMHSRTLPAVQDWGSDISLVFGDFLYSQAYRIVADSSNADVSACLSEAIDNNCQTELSALCGQNGGMENNESRSAIYFSACCQVGAICVGASDSLVQSLKSYGSEIGLALDLLQGPAKTNDDSQSQSDKAKASSLAQSAIKKLADLEDSKYKAALTAIADQLSC